MLLEPLEPLMELFMRGALAAELPLPGVTLPELVHPVSRNGERLIAFLKQALRDNEALARTVQVAIFRFTEVARAAGWRQETALVNQNALKRYIFQLANMASEFRPYPMLYALFPEATTLETAATAPLAGEELVRSQRDRAELLKRARSLEAFLAPKLAVLQEALKNVEQARTLGWSTLFVSASAHKALVIAKELREDAAALGRAKDTLRRYAALKRLLALPRTGERELEQLRELVFPLGQLAQAFPQQKQLSEWLAGS